MSEFVDQIIDFRMSPEEKVKKIEQLMFELIQKKREITEIYKKEVSKYHLQKREKARMWRKKNKDIFKCLNKYYLDKNSDKLSCCLVNNLKNNYWVFSYGGCGTNYLRKMLNIYSLRGYVNVGIPSSIHTFNPPKIEKSQFSGFRDSGEVGPPIPPIGPLGLWPKGS